jgi:hypothetical protein
VAATDSRSIDKLADAGTTGRGLLPPLGPLVALIKVELPPEHGHPAELREELEPLNDRELLEQCRELRYESMEAPVDAARYTLRALAERHRTLDHEARLHERVLATLTGRAAPALSSRFGIAEDSAAELHLVVGDNRSASAARLPWPSSAAPALSRHHLARPPGIDLTAAGTGRPTPPCIAF